MKSVVSTGFILVCASPIWRSILSFAETHDSSSWKLVWADEFNNEIIDSQKWTILEGDGCDSYLGCGWGQGQIEVASKDNAYISADGNLVMVARYDIPENKTLWSSKHQSYDGRMITSARLSTHGSADFLHGRVEVRAKVAPGGWGGWSAIWLLPSEDRGSPRASCARVNIVEITSDVENSATASLQFGRKDSGCVSSNNWPHEGSTCVLSPAWNVALSDDFHVFGLEWDENEFRWFLDGLHFCTKTTWFGGDPDAAYPAPFDKAFHVEIGLPVGGWGQSVESRAAAVDTSAMPKEMVIDYVRISQGPSGSLWTPPPESSSTLPVFMLAALALAACVLGFYMAIAGLRILGCLFHYPTYRSIPGVIDGCDTHNEPTPVPLPPSGGHSKMVSNEGDTIELVVHSPKAVAQQHKQRVKSWFQPIPDAQSDTFDHQEPSGGLWARAFQDKWGSWLSGGSIGEKIDPRHASMSISSEEVVSVENDDEWERSISSTDFDIAVDNAA